MATLYIPWRLYYPLVPISVRPDSYAVSRKSAEWYPATNKTSTITYSTLKNVENRIQKELTDQEGKLRYVERSMSQAYGRDTTRRNADILKNVSSYNRVGLTFNGRTYLSLYQEYATLVAAAQFTATIIRSHRLV